MRNELASDAIEINAEDPGVRRSSKRSVSMLVRARFDRAFVKIGAIAQAVDRFLVSIGFGEPVIDTIEKFDASLVKRRGLYSEAPIIIDAPQPLDLQHPTPLLTRLMDS